MPTVRGRAAVRSFIKQLPQQLQDRVLRGAARAGGAVIAEEASARSASDEVAQAITTKTKKNDDRIVVKISVKPGWTYSVGVWLEYGTAPHFISVDDAQREGRTVRRINKLAKGGHHSLVIGGKFVGATVFHPGARAIPFLRPALDTKEREAIAAAQAFINSRVGRTGITGLAEDDDA